MDALAQFLAPYGMAPREPLTGQGGLFGLMSMLLGSGQGGAGGGAPVPSSGPTSYDPNASRWEDVAARMAQRKYGWGPQDFSAIDEIISRESGWNPNAVNPSSGAYGIPQILPAAHPDDLGLGPRQQISWLLDYIKNRYGTPEQAWAFKQDKGWY